MIKIDLSKARNAQRMLSSRAARHDLLVGEPRFIAGVDVAFKRKKAIGAAVNISFPEAKVLERRTFVTEVYVPYIPTYLAFREIGAMIGAVRRLELEPDVILVDAHGMLHPRAAGEATHLGVVLGIPTIGVAKSMLVGKVDDDGFIIYRGERLGYKLRENVYISLGHGVSLPTAIRLVSRLCIYNIPEPTRQAHILANEIKNSL